MQIFGDVAEIYADFAGEAANTSPCFEQWARGVVGDPEVQTWLRGLPGERERQPNLVFAAARWHGVDAPGPYAALRAALLGDDGAIRQTVTRRRTQTNEAGRLATITPVLAGLAARHGEPLALVEIGASAGLCLYPDRWDHTWLAPDGGVVACTEHGHADRLRCEVTGVLPPSARWPRRPVPVAWRGGLDLAPVDVADDEQVAWLRMLVWPEHEDRRERLAAAVVIARADPPVIARADLVAEPEVLDDLVEEAGRHGRVVVLHSAVTAYLAPEDRSLLEARLRGLVGAGRCHWLSNEGPRVHPAVTATGPAVPAGLATFVLGLDGQALAWTDGHGRSLHWL